MRLYLLWRLGGALKRGFQSATGAPTQESDPIDHPAIAAMSLRELADLPLRPDPLATRAPSHKTVDLEGLVDGQLYQSHENSGCRLNHALRLKQSHKSPLCA
jgi:hypothetical protein